MNANDLQIFDNLCTAAFSSTDNQERTKSLDAIKKFETQGFWQHNLLILQQSQNIYSLHFASKNLTRIFTQYHNSFPSQARGELCTALLHVVAKLSDLFWSTAQVREPLVECFARVQKLSWFEVKSLTSDGALSQILPFLKHSLSHSIFGISLLQQLVFEMSTPTKGVSLPKQRKISTAFREDCLIEIFKVGISSLPTTSNLSANEQEKAQQLTLLGLCIKLLEQCLSFDFIGTTFDDSLDGLNLVYVPSPWEEFFSEGPAQKLFSVYEAYPPPYSTQCLQVLELFAGTRSSLFTTFETRTAFLNGLVNGIGLTVHHVNPPDTLLGAILAKNKDLENDENRHSMSRILLRLKTSYQLKYLQETQNYAGLIEQAARFSIETIRTAHTFNTVFYILSFWGKMVTAHSLGAEQNTYVDTYAPSVATAFIESQLANAQNPNIRDALLQSEQLDSVLEELSGIVMCNYHQIVLNMVNGVTALAQQFQSVLAQPTSSPETILQSETQLAWMVYIASAILKTPMRRIGREDTAEEEILQLEAQLICVLFEYLGVHDARLEQRGVTSSATQHLELAYIAFLQKFCKYFIRDESFSTTKILYDMLSTKFGMMKPTLVVDRVVKKIVQLLEQWPTHPEIVDKNLGPSGLFLSLATSWAASKVMSKSAVVSSLLRVHAQINPGEESQTHVAFYKTLGRLMFTSHNDYTTFYQFVAPWQERIAQMQTLLTCAQPKPVHAKFIQMMDDMRGFVSSMESKAGGYQMFFDWFYTEMGYYQWLLNLMSTGTTILELEDVWAITRFATELSHNRSQRISFDVTSAEGIKLFRSTAELLLHFGNFMNATQWQDRGDDKYKSVGFYVKCVQKTLSGNYTNFGIFELYNDPILSNLLVQCFSLLFSLDMRELELYPKVSSQIFTTLETITSHTEFVILLETHLFGQCLRLLAKALHSNIPAIVSQACTSLDKITSLHFSNVTKSQRQKTGLYSKRLLDAGNLHMETHRQVLASIIIQLLSLLITGEAVQWTVSRPLLSLMLLLPQEFEAVAQLVMVSQNSDPEKAAKMTEQFNKLTEGIQRNISSGNREKFLFRVTNFHKEVKEFIDLNSFYKHILQFTKDAE